MSGGIYGGDEVGAIVFDCGSHSFRAGYGGEEYPKFDIPSYIGVREVIETTTDDTIDEVASGKKSLKKNEYFIDTPRVFFPRKNTEITTYMKDGMIEDWDIFEQVLDYLYGSCLYTESQHHSILFTEAPWNEKDKREKLTELMFEKYKVPAFFLIKNAVLSAFANGRVSSLVLDSGATHTSAVPVYDGYCITHAVVHSPIGGDFIAEQCRRLLEKQNIDVVPYYKVGSKKEVKDGEAPIWTLRSNLPDVTKSYDEFMRKQLIEDFAHLTLQLCDTPIDVEFMEKLPAVSYGFPCGFRKDFLAERAKIPEALFDLKYIDGEKENSTIKSSLMDVSQIAATSCGMCDVDIRQSLYSSLMVTGGNSLITGFTERLNHDLAHKCPATMKLRVSAAPTTVERRYGAWIGGSIVSSLGTFQQLWIGKGEYEESGKSIIERKCM